MMLVLGILLVALLVLISAEAKEYLARRKSKNVAATANVVSLAKASKIQKHKKKKSSNAKKRK
jgi:hypothetical protein